MIRTIALWGAEFGWKGQEKWRKALRTLQYQSLRRCTGALQGTAQLAVDQIAGVEPIEAKLDAMQARFAARSLGNPAAMEGLCPRFRDYRRRMVQGGIKQTMKTADGSENRQPRDSGRQSGGIAGARRR